MKGTVSRLERFCTSWKFFLMLVVLQFIVPPIASNGFEYQEIGTIILRTLSKALIQHFYPYAFVFQAITLLFLLAVMIGRKKTSRWFTLYVTCSYLLYAVIQNIAITSQYGFSMVTMNVVMMLLVAYVWLRDCWKGENEYTFTNLNGKTAWLVLVALFCLWWPMNIKTGAPDFNPLYLFTGGSAMAFCPMTPVFLVILIWCKPTINRTTYRVTAMVGLIIGCFNMGSFAHPAGFYLGIYHLPLLLLSLYALISSKRAE